MATDRLDTTWVCRVCGDRRPDACIGVAIGHIGHYFDMPDDLVKNNVCHCKDRPGCIRIAHEMSRLKHPDKHPECYWQKKETDADA